MPQLSGVVPGCPVEGRSSAGVLLSRNQGRSWTRSKPIDAEPDDGSVLLLEGAAAEQGNGALLQLFRTHVGALYSITSQDGGSSWSRALPSWLPNPNSKANLLRLEVGCFPVEVSVPSFFLAHFLHVPFYFSSTLSHVFFLSSSSSSSHRF
jgi:predicted neuraminidase